MNNRAIAGSNTNRREKGYGYIYLFNLIIPISFLLLFPLGQALMGAFLIAMFALFYLLAFRNRRFRFFSISIQIAIMMVMMGYFNDAYIWMIFYPAACSALFFERRHVPIAMGSIAVIIIAENYVLSLFHPYALSDWLMILAAIVAGSAACFGTIWQRQTMESREQLREAYLRIERLTKIAERERISRDLHDVMGHELSMITLKSQLVEKLIERDPDRAKSEIRDIEQAARQALTRVREYVTGKRQPDFDEEWKDATKILNAAGIICDANLSPILGDTSDASLQAIAMCLREATTNLVRYSKATHCRLRMCQHTDTFSLTICDNGKGIHPKQTRNDGNGINGIRARVAAVGGRLTLWSNGDVLGAAEPVKLNPSPWSNGVALLIEIPCRAAANTEEMYR